jgi:2-iminobutanoate/2-iminopropanoate deaminase
MSKRTKIDPGWKWDDNYVVSQAIEMGNTVYVSGQLALDPDGSVVGEGDMRVQARQVLSNIQEILRAAGASMENVVKTTIFTTDIPRLMEIQDVRGEFFSEPPPANTGVEVKALAFPGCLIEIEAIAVKAS